MQKQDIMTYTSANKDYTLTNVYVTENWLKQESFQVRIQNLLKNILI